MFVLAGHKVTTQWGHNVESESESESFYSVLLQTQETSAKTISGRFTYFSYNAQHQQADDFGIWGVHAEGAICGKIGKYVE